MSYYICTTYAGDKEVRSTRYKTYIAATEHAERVLASTLELSAVIGSPSRRATFRATVRAGDSGAALFEREIVA